MENKDYSLFFIYGTLKKDEYNYGFLQDMNAIFLDEVETIEKYPLYLLNQPFPYLEETKDIGNNIKGELFLIKNDFIYNLDEFEGTPDLYYRGKIQIFSKYFRIEKEVFTYFVSKKRFDKNYKKNISLLKEFKG